MWKSALIVIAALLLLINASSVRADVTVSEQSVTVPETLRVSGGPEGWRATPHYRVHKAAAAPGGVRPEYITGQGYEPSQILGAYGISGTGAGQTIAIVDAYGSPTIYQDLSAFCQRFRLPRANLTVVGPQGNDPGWALETSLDVEWAHALAPDAAILLVVAQSDSLTDLFAAVQYAAQNAQVVSMSWSGDEVPNEAAYDSIFQHPGTVFIAASGDSGSGPQYPAASPNVVAAGGTTLYLNHGTGALKFPESAWEGSGGGVSQYELIPSYQAALGIGGTNRCIPDVAFAADPNTGVYVYNQGWYVLGGTSVATPSWAAVVALANQERAVKHQPSLTDGHQELYDLAATSYGKCYRDITTGFNGDFAATPGYDLVTGLGSPKAKKLVPTLRLVP